MNEHDRAKAHGVATPAFLPLDASIDAGFQLRPCNDDPGVGGRLRR
jgi:hypothetical protein